MKASTSLPGSRVMACRAPLAGAYALSYSSSPHDWKSQCGNRGAHDRVEDYGPRVGATALAPTTLSYDLGRFGAAL